MVEKCSFNKDCDLGVVIKGLGVDINDLITNHKVGTSKAEVIYNQFSSLEDIGCRINDDFDLYQYYKTFSNDMKMNANVGTGSSQGPLPVQTNVSE